jgi:hypothetical protein
LLHACSKVAALQAQAESEVAALQPQAKWQNAALQVYVLRIFNTIVPSCSYLTMMMTMMMMMVISVPDLTCGT